MRYKNRVDAGQQLARAVAQQHPDLVGNPKVLVLGLPRGGVVVAAEVAATVLAPLDVLVVRKLGVPWQPELAFGAVTATTSVLNPSVAGGISQSERDRVVEREAAEVRNRERQFRAGRPPLDLAGRIALIVDDGLATGATALAAVRAARAMGAERVVLAVPVAAADSLGAFAGRDTRAGEADAVVAPLVPEHFFAVGNWYDDFDQTGDSEVRALLG